jgi:hypothetical protein
MHIELDCARCFCHFTSVDSAPPGETHDPVLRDEPWSFLGDGSTFEDLIYATLMDRGGICCPQCGAPVAVSEESLGRLAMDMLAVL